MAFTPKKKNDIKDEIKKHLLDGDIIRCDCQGETPLEVISRDYLKYLPTMNNIGQQRDEVYKTINCAHSVLIEVTNELDKEYSVKKVRCSHSGCCQYTTYGFYLD